MSRTRWRYLPYTLTLRSPLLATSPAGDPNSAGTLRYLPGSAMRGAIARLITNRLGGDARQAALEALVLGGEVRYLNAYPTVGGRRCLPTPVAWRPEKHEPVGADPVTLYDLTAGPAGGDPWPDADEDGDQDAGSEGRRELGSPVVGFVDLGDPWVLAPVRTFARLHQQRDRALGRAWTDKRPGHPEVQHGTLFAYEALDAGQRLAGLVAVADDDRASAVARLLGRLCQQGLLLGRSRSAGYGGNAVVDWGQPRDREVVDIEVDGDVPEGARFRVLLTADYLGRDAATGQPDPAWLPEELRRRLGPGSVEVTSVQWSFTQVGSYNRTWGMPLPSRRAVAAGSVVDLVALTTVPAGRLDALEQDGLGERKVDGFGRCLVLPLSLPARVWLEPERQPPPPDVGECGAPTVLARLIEERIAGERVRRRIEEAAAEIAASVPPGGLPSASLLGRLRVPLRDGGAVAALTTLASWLAGRKDQQLRSIARDQLDRCRIVPPQWPRTTLADWLTELATGSSTDRLRRLLQLDPIAAQAHVVSSQALAERLDAQTVDWRVDLIDQTLAALQRRAKADRREGDHD